ncbi:hypothetical protein PPTG_05035 [Phytophthora nicotianae INRA-310]|uniref:Uncharacterized protein n=3 Tax=Phytophthora nicotianae TaxID=4792 RepID=W2QVK7_PHYN3|nr:hypothetical protein PPTG_05035 [Phytophthora nicotianae INRA-310]ETI34613.1 hypothetical protein F443_18903 [Phytophthora nicotianae P1569]ETN17163.1 hypothetical protein PPTG_05035 [Phytophthora nicotianae INRA-310]
MICGHLDSSLCQQRRRTMSMLSFRNLLTESQTATVRNPVMNFIKPIALLLALVAGQLDTSVAQDAAAQIAQIGTDAVSRAEATSSITNSISAALARIDPSGGALQDTIAQLVEQANANAAVDAELNTKLQALLDSISQSYTDTEDNVSPIFNGRNLRAED